MIQITKTKTKISVLGHANFAPEGQDIVCAAISTLAQNLICSFNELTQDNIEYDIAPGRVDIEYRNLSAEGNLLVSSFFIGVKQIAESYPGNVRVYL